MPAPNDKRNRLTSAADDLILRQGFGKTTLADIAETSGVPLGNLYYYFRTKEAIANRVIHCRLESLQQLLCKCSEEPSPKAQLLAFLDYPLKNSDSLAKHGCPLGTLNYELSRTAPPLDEAAGTLIQTLLDWSQERFRLMEVADPDSSGLQFVCALQGMSLVANGLKQPGVIDTMVSAIRSWIESLEPGALPPTT